MAARKASGRKSTVVRAKKRSAGAKHAAIRHATGRVSTRGQASLSKGVRSR